MSITNLTIASTNKDRIAKLKNVISGLYPKIVVQELSNDIIEPDENGDSVMENAKIKVEYYSKLINMPVLVVDSGIYFDNGISEEEQEGHKIHKKIINLKNSEKNVTEYWVNYLKSNNIMSGYIKKVFILMYKDNISIQHLSIPFKIMIPEVKDNLLHHSNPLNFFMVPKLFDKTFYSFNKRDRNKYEKMYTNRTIMNLVREFEEYEYNNKKNTID